MFGNFMTWRKENDVDNIIENFDFSEGVEIQKVYPHGYHKIDKLGRPIYIERIGLLDVPAVFTLSTEERMVKHNIQAYELLMNWRFPSCSEVAGKHIGQSCAILDMTHGSIGTVNKRVYGLVKLAAQVGSDYYPECMGNTFVVNAPFLFAGVWAICKGFLDEKTRKKIKIIGGGFLSTLRDYIEDQDIPTFLGGQCTCEEFGGNCLTSDRGPWNDFEFVKPKGVKRKQAMLPDELCQEGEVKGDQEPA